MVHNLIGCMKLLQDPDLGEAARKLLEERDEARGVAAAILIDWEAGDWRNRSRRLEAYPWLAEYIPPREGAGDREAGAGE